MENHSDYEPPKDIWEVSGNIQYNALPPNDPRYVSTGVARGDFNFDELLKYFGVDKNTAALRVNHRKQYALFFGHRGCGKSTELKRLAHMLRENNTLFVVELDVYEELNVADLQYPDILFALTKKLLVDLEKDGISIDQVHWSKLESWFSSKVTSRTELTELGVEIQAGASGKSGIPFLGEIFAKFTSKIKGNAAYKEEIRSTLRNFYAEFADAFNSLLVAAESKITEAHKGAKILFIVDGTDKISLEDGQKLFVDDVGQLQQIESLFIYCAPIPLIHTQGVVQQYFGDFCLPMIKLHDKGSEDWIKEGKDVMRKMLLKRADISLFDSEETIEKIIHYSGGHIRDLLRILDYAFQKSVTDQFDATAVDKAIKALSSDFRQFLEEEDYVELVKIDKAPKSETAPNDRIRNLLYNLALLRYNDFWWQSHPVVRKLPGYQAALEKYEQD